MNKSLKTFFRVLKSYSIEEKVLSIIVVATVFFLSLESVTGFFKSPNFLNNQSEVYHEGLVSDRPILINPLFADFNDAAREVTSLVFSGLTKYDPQKKNFVADLADLTISEDRKTYHFTLKPNLSWHDGKPLTADDVYFTFHDLIQNLAFQNPVLQADFQGIEVKKIDDRTIEFVLQAPNAFFITNTNVGILPEHLLADLPIEELPTANFNLKPIGSGPYKIESPLETFELGQQSVSLKVFDNFYGEKPKINQFRFHFYAHFNDLKKAAENLNVISKVPSSEVAELQNSYGFQPIHYELPQYIAIFLNLDREVFKKEKVRIALQKAIDKQELLKLLSDKIAVDTPLLDLNQSEWIYKVNVQEAQGALFDSGYKIDKTKKDDPYRYDKDGKILELNLLARSYDQGTNLAEENKKVTDFLINAWKNAGVKVTLQSVDNDTFLQKLQNRDYDLVLAGQSLGYNLDTYSYWHSTQAQRLDEPAQPQPDGADTQNTTRANIAGLNLSNYKSFAADQLIEKIRDTFDTNEKEARLKDLAKVIAQDIPAIFLYRPRYTLMAREKVTGVSLENLAFISDRFANISQWCIVCSEK